VSDLVPNLAELAATLPTNSDGVAVAGAFEVSTVEAARMALRAVVDGWENRAVSGDASNDKLITAVAG
jgi:hypothetical protein